MPNLEQAVTMTMDRFRQIVRDQHQWRTMEMIANDYGLNLWHVSNLISRDDFVLSKKLRKKLCITLDPPRNRVSVNLDDPKSIFETLIGKYRDGALEFDALDRLARLLHEFVEETYHDQL